MKTILHLKQGDLATQIIALGIPSILCFITQGFAAIMMAYFIVGGVQFLSCLLNIALNNKLRNKSRRYYELTLLGIISIFVLSIVFDPESGTLVAIGLLFISPFLAIWYGYITYDEIRIVKRYVNRNKYILTN